MSDLIEFLKSLVLTTVQVDKKYRETIPALIDNIKSLVESSDEGPKKKGKPRKMKVGKDSLYPLEDESIRQWWASNKPELRGDQVTPSMAQIKSHASLLRTRETQLQMIVILEILALEPLKSSDDTGDASLPALPGTTTGKGAPAASQTIKKRNKHNLPVLVDVHADRLTIWQSTASDDQILLEDSQALPSLPDNRLFEKSSSEALKDFCVDVIVPL